MLVDLYKSEYRLFPLEWFPANADLDGPEPTPDFVKSVKDEDQIHPVIVAVLLDDSHFIVDGGRRIKANRVLGKTTVEAIIRYGVPRDVALRWRMESNEQRKPNPIAIIHAIREKLDLGLKTPKEIGLALNLTIAAVKKYLPMANDVPQEILDAASRLIPGQKRAAVSVGALQAVAKLNGLKNEAVRILQAQGHLTEDDVRGILKNQRQILVRQQPGLQFQPAETHIQSVFIVVTEDGELMLPQTFPDLTQAEDEVYRAGGFVLECKRV